MNNNIVNGWADATKTHVVNNNIKGNPTYCGGQWQRASGIDYIKNVTCQFCLNIYNKDLKED